MYLHCHATPRSALIISDDTSYDQNRRTALHGAAYHGYIEVVTLLLDHHANIEAVDNVRQNFIVV